MRERLFYFCSLPDIGVLRVALKCSFIYLPLNFPLHFLLHRIKSYKTLITLKIYLEVTSPISTYFSVTREVERKKLHHIFKQAHTNGDTHINLINSTSLKKFLDKLIISNFFV